MSQMLSYINQTYIVHLFLGLIFCLSNVSWWFIKQKPVCDHTLNSLFNVPTRTNLLINTNVLLSNISLSFYSRITICNTLVNQEYRDFVVHFHAKSGQWFKCSLPHVLLPLYDTKMLHYRGQNQHHLQSSIRLWPWINNKQWSQTPKYVLQQRMDTLQ